ncbi:exopolysaccharide biosynthesis polyprenyl glycosylphosphotransferase [Amycolatopsis arida]|uniref:Exopolysaccharide biosynthesis polyprenyl glycosylphosphotransferase n=1 Tax=Amycolatopsis arida TaxID=587909 RepID=A0A1I5XEG8_9PSEU|nr:sugar transferase [Amycolatopsis arida]TDX97503.1 exopolysaccharide biosynthesis polyprenyl glycosylphosphotransferase [Amycolatopsis arida]SFQ30294.1 exopolysaccharide biosynthesis polyprenyl glycosylphosphotransferase [Amycolatopsis arida]
MSQALCGKDAAPAEDVVGAPRPAVTTATTATTAATATSAPTGAQRRLGQSLVTGLSDVVCAALAVVLVGPAVGWPVAAGAAALVLVTAPAGLDGYHWRSAPSVLDDAPGLIGRGCVAALAAVAALVLADAPDEAKGVLLAAAAIAALTLAGRVCAYTVLGRLRRRGIGLASAIVIGCGEEGLRLGRALRANPDYGARVVGFVDDGPAPAGTGAPPLLGPLDDLPDLVRRHGVDLVLVAFGRRGSAELVEPLRALGRLRCRIHILPRLFEMYDVRRAELVDGIALVRLRRAAFRRRTLMVKRVVDTTLAALALVLLSPVLAVVALAVRLESGPGVIFKQQRVGMNGVPFTLYKFRSLRPVGDEADTRWNIDHDSRLGPVGRFIRRTSLDELPQLWNIVKGDMSVVGPRPERPYFVDEFSRTVPGYAHRHRVPVGLTGYAVTHGLRGDTSIEHRALFDNLYAESWSLWLDVKIVLRTARQVLWPR